ncbi:alpha/beta hydrolase [Patescibacteria group bacterium]|nr:alpha/beta hydrolase [Patescibacteria group bacterium]MBU4023491.1 alpha/beta hydrolase [Patescibacteria group bacterium]MBU4078403.1 alpha/beta hydrolase [Patescibacteria group bacterium]
MEEKFIQVNNLKVFVRIQGQGSPFLILHGWGASTKSWIRVQKELSERFLVICPDLPGFGKSDLPDSAWDIDAYLNFVIALAKELGIEKFYLLGHSFGGRIAIKLAESFPEKLEKLILIDAAGIKPKAPNWFISLLSKFMGIFKFVPGFKIGRRAYYKLILRSTDYLKTTGIMREVFKKIIAEDLVGCLENIKTKTLVIWGKEDKLTPLKDGQLMNKKISNSKLDILNTGHVPHLVMPEIVAKKIIDFIYGK